MRLRSLRMANDETLHTLFCYLSDQSTIVVVCIRFFFPNPETKLRQWMTNELVGLGLMNFEKKDRNASPSCIDVPGAAIRVKLLENQMVASNGAHLHKTPNVNWYNSRPGQFVWSWDPKKAGWHKHPEGTRIFFQKLTSLPLCELGMSFQNQCCPSIWGHSLLRLPSSEAVLVPSAYICCSWFKLCSKKEGEALRD